MHWQADPDEETTDWRAVCGRTARTVRRAGTARAVPDPYRNLTLPIRLPRAVPLEEPLPVQFCNDVFHRFPPFGMTR